jgi:hypothetical protein
VQNITASGDGPPEEIHPAVAAVAPTYGDPNGKYAAFLASGDSQYPAQPYFLWNQPLSDSGLAAATPSGSGQPRPTSKNNALLSTGSATAVWHATLSVIVPFLWTLYGVA